MRDPDVCIGDLAPRRRFARATTRPRAQRPAGAADHGDATRRPITATRPGRPIVGRPGR